MIRSSYCRGHHLQFTQQIRSLRSGTSHPDQRLGLQYDAPEKKINSANLEESRQIVLQMTTYSHAIKRIRARISQTFSFSMTGRSGTSSLSFDAHSIFLFIQKSMNFIVCGSLTVLGLILLIEFFLRLFVGDKTEEGRMLKAEHDYYRSRNQSKDITQRLSESG